MAAWAYSTWNPHLESVKIFNFFSFPNYKTVVNAVSSASWTEVQGGGALVSVTSSRLTRPCLLGPISTKLLRSVNQMTLRVSRGSSRRSDLLDQVYSRLSTHWCSKSPLLTARSRVAGFRVWHTFKVISGASIRRAWYLVNLPPVNQWCPAQIVPDEGLTHLSVAPGELVGLTNQQDCGCFSPQAAWPTQGNQVQLFWKVSHWSLIRFQLCVRTPPAIPDLSWT